MKKSLLFIAMIVTCMTAIAYTSDYGDDIIISQPVYSNLYLAGGTVTINAPIHGDLIIAGGTVTINDTVTKDILLIGGKVVFNGFAGDDIRCAGGNIRISKNVTGDVVVTGGGVIIDPGITIGGLLAAGGRITVDGNVNGEMKGVFGDLILNGNVSRDIDCRGGRITVNGAVGGKSVLSAKNIIIGNNAVFNGDVRYWTKKGSVDFKQSLKNSKAVYDPELQIITGEWYYLGATTVFGLLWYLGMAFLMLLIIQYLFSATMKKAADAVFNNSLKSLGFGFLFFIAVPIAAIVAFITVVGVPVGLLLLFGYITLILLAMVITSVVVANWFNNRYDKNWKLWRMVLVAFGIFIVLKLIIATPFIGWLLMLIMVCMAFGGILLNVNWKRKQPGIIAT